MESASSHLEVKDQLYEIQSVSRQYSPVSMDASLTPLANLVLGLKTFSGYQWLLTSRKHQIIKVLWEQHQ